VAVNWKTENYNLLVEDWIPVLWRDGQYSRVGIIQAPSQEGKIKRLGASNPIDPALSHLLLLVLKCCKPPLSAARRNTLDKAGNIP